MSQGKAFRPEVRAMAEALYRAGHSTRQISDLIMRATTETPPSDAALRDWKRHMRTAAPDNETVVLADLVGRATREDLARAFAGGIEVIAEAKRRRLGEQETLQFVALKLMARLLRLPGFEALAESLACQWETHAMLRETLPEEDTNVHVALSYLWSVEREVGYGALGRAWDLKEEQRAATPQ